MSQSKQTITTSSGGTAQVATDGVAAELLMEENIENATDVLSVSVINDDTNVVPELNEVSSHGTALSFVSGPTFSAGSMPSVTLQGSTTTYIPVQVCSSQICPLSRLLCTFYSFMGPRYIVTVPGVIETAFTQTPAFAAPVIYPSAFTTAYITGTAAAPAATPCTFLSAATPITAVCHCIYAQPCALHHRPLSYASNSLSLGAMQTTLSQSHPHTLSTAATNNGVTTRVPSLPSTMALPPRSAAMRLKRSGEQLGVSYTPAAENAGNIRGQKLRRLEQANAHATTSDLGPQRNIEVRTDEGNSTDGNRSNTTNSPFCCECRRRAAYQCPYQYCPYHNYHHQLCPRHPLCFCQRNESSASYRRETDINPVHDMLLSARMAQIERQQHANNMWFQRQSLASGNLIGVDVVPRRVTSQPVVILPRHHQPVMELAMVLLQPHDPSLVLGGNVPSSNDPVPVGATVEQINRFSTMYKYLKENDVPENEQERCTVCLSDFETDEEVRALRCNHLFHVVCIDRWLLYNKKCPVCRLDLDKSSNGESPTASV